MEQAINYPNENIDRLELAWRTGFLSPGGSDEVGEILKDVDICKTDDSYVRLLLNLSWGLGPTYYA